MAQKGSENSALETRENWVVHWPEPGARKDFLLASSRSIEQAAESGPDYKGQK